MRALVAEVQDLEDQLKTGGGAKKIDPWPYFLEAELLVCFAFGTEPQIDVRTVRKGAPIIGARTV